MEKNIKLFPIYKLFSYDILFYYAITAIYFTQTKGLSLSELALITTAYSFSAILFQIPSAVIVDKIGTKASMITGNILLLLWGLNLIISNAFPLFIAGEFICGFGFALKGVSESPFLLASLKKINREDEFAKTESKGSVLYFLIEAVACVLSGYLYTVNCYLPIIFACTCCLISVVLSCQFTKINKSSEKISTKKYFADLKSGFKFIFKSRRLNALLLFACLFYGIIQISNIFMKSYFTEFNLSSTGFGYVYAIFAIFAALGSKIQNIVEKKHKNKTLTFFSFAYTGLLLIAGIFALFNFNDNVLINIGVIVFATQSILKGAYRIIIKQYVTRYTTQSIRPKLMSIYYLSENAGSTILSAFSSLLLAHYSTGLATSIAGFVIVIAVVCVLEFMRPRMGLSPDKYTARDRYDLNEKENSSD